MHRTRRFCALFVTMAAATGLLVSCGAHSGQAAPTATTLTPASTGGGTRGGHGGTTPGPSGGTTAAPGAVVPAGWPAVVPVPPGVTQSTNPSPGVWVLGILMNGDATAVRTSLVQLFQGHGFTVDPVADIPIILTSPTYTIRVAMFPRDHAAQTNVALTLTRH
jgi:hypothetical protein